MERQNVHNAYRPWEFCQQQDYLLKRSSSLPYVTSLLRISKGITCPSCLCAHLHHGADEQSQPQWLEIAGLSIKKCVCVARRHTWAGEGGKSDLCVLCSWVSYQCQESPENHQFPILRVGDRVSEARVSLEEPGSMLEALCFFHLPLGVLSTFSAKCYRTLDHVSQFLQENCKELFCMTLLVCFVTVQRVE